MRCSYPPDSTTRHRQSICPSMSVSRFGEAPERRPRFATNSTYIDVCVAEIQRHYREIDAGSLLDIGAGDGALANRIAMSVGRYVAIECEPEFVANLRTAGLQVIESVFPDIQLDARFDLVLCAHGLPEQLASCRE